MCLCLGACLGSCAATCFCQAISGASRMMAKVIYAFIFLTAVVIAWVLRDYSGTTLGHIDAIKCRSGESAYKSCLGSEGVLRISCGAFLFFALMFITTIGTTHTSDCRDTWQSGCFPVKLFLWAGFTVACFFIPSAFFQVYGQIARIGSGFFLIIQIISVLNFIYVWNSYWLDSEREETYRIPMVLVSAVCFLLTLAGVVVMYVYFAPRASCSLNIFFITWTIILIIGLTCISLHPDVNAGLMTSSLVAIYLVYLCYNAIMSEPKGYSCNTRARQTGEGDWVTVTSFVLAFFVIAVSVLQTGLDHAAFSLSDVESPGEDEVPYAYGFFHTVFALASMYLAMLYLGWDLSRTSVKWSMDVGWVSVWVKIVAQWITAIIYGWTMVGPLVLKDRTFY